MFVPPVVILDCGPAHPDDVLVFERPLYIIEAADPAGVSDAFARLEKARDAGLHLAGWFAYELGYLLEPRLKPLYRAHAGLPLLWFGVFGAPQRLSRSALGAHGRAYRGPLRHNLDANAYEQRFSRVHRYIAEGDIYQANLTLSSCFGFAGDPFALYLDLHEAAGIAHGAYVDTVDRQVLSLSPELHFSISASGTITSRPMKGTVARGADAQTDARNRNALETSEKERAENLMIVDLIRNDLGRIAKAGSVRVPQLFAIETYPALYTMVSTVSAQLGAGVSLLEIMKAIFPCGSVTGAPKIRAMEIIRELEPCPRGIYCGSIGHFAPDGSASFNVAIRTILIDHNKGVLGLGGAIVHDSRANLEYAECLLKSRFFDDDRRPLSLIETLRREESLVRLDRHLDRMARSAEVLSLPFERGAALAALAAAGTSHKGHSRVRLTLDEHGTFLAGAKPLEPETAAWKFAISPVRVDSDDVLRRHKTDWRDPYDAEWKRVAREGLDEVVFLNERGELTEGSRTNIFLRRASGLVTPPVSSGLLAGVLRNELIESGACTEALLHPDDLARADAVFLGNSLRGLIPAVGPEP